VLWRRTDVALANNELTLTGSIMRIDDVITAPWRKLLFTVLVLSLVVLSTPALPRLPELIEGGAQTSVPVVREVTPGVVAEGSPDQQARISKDNVVIAADGGAIHSGTQLTNNIALTSVGQRVTLARDGAEQTFSVQIAPANAATGPNRTD
jgi:S1-C subfamily serine protease